MNNTSPTNKEILSWVVKISTEAGELLKDLRSKNVLNPREKGARDLVTDIDIAVENFLTDKLKQKFPQHRILAEESSDHSAILSEGIPTWVIDPVDGTTNLAYNHPTVCISIALVQNGQSILGVINAPLIGELYTALRGNGAFLNDQRLPNIKPALLKDALIATGFPYARDRVEILSRRVFQILSNCRDIRRIGAAALDICWVASGKLDAYYESFLKPWDIAAAQLIAAEVGANKGVFSSEHSSIEGSESELYCDEVLIAPEPLFSELQKVLAKA